MSDQFSVPVSVPLDDDGFLRRTCPTCHLDFKLLDDDSLEWTVATQLFCPLCGEPGRADQWTTDQQQAYGLAAAGPEMERMVRDALRDSLRGIKGLKFKPNQDFSLDMGDPVPPHEPNDMVAVTSPCHPEEAVKVPDDRVAALSCVICGAPFAT